MTETVKLKCGTCGARPTPDEAKYTAKLGGPHFRRVDHGVGIPGRRGRAFQLRTCGSWVEDKEPERRT